MPQWMQNLAAGWPMIRANLPTFFVILSIMVGGVWVAVNWSYSSILASKNAQIELLDRQIASLRLQTPAHGQGPRRLSEGQRRDIAERLKNGNSTVLVTTDLTCGDCGQYAADFIRVLGDAGGWSVLNGGVMGPANRPQSGLGLRIPDLNSPSAEVQRIIRALKSNNIDFDLQQMPPSPVQRPGQIEFLIVAP